MSADAYTCPMCGAAVPHMPLGRPRTYCSPECRREMEHLRRDLPILETALLEAKQKAASGYWPGPHYWGAEAHRLKLAVDEGRSRISPRTPA
jgi:hypothetical protein